MITIDNVTKTYRQGSETIHALDGLSLEIERGEILAIIGPSGSGKSTLMNLIGLLDRPTTGGISINGRPVGKLREAEKEALRRTSIGFVFQQFLLVPTMSALRNVMLPMYFAGKRDGVGEATRLLARVGLGSRLHHLPSQMSGGEIQRVAIARALANNPEIVLADEPTGNLDSRTAEEVVALLREINESGTTVLIVTHNIELASKLPRMVAMRDGRMVKNVKNNS
jgi:putative ABC transport system ATP-binding protein